MLLDLHLPQAKRHVVDEWIYYICQAVLAFAFLGPLQSLWRPSPGPTGQIDQPVRVVTQPQPQDIQMPRVIAVGLVRQTSLASVPSVVRISLTQPQSGTDETNRNLTETKGEVICYAGPALNGPGDTSPENSAYDLNSIFF